jgi:hypothetical protein
MAAGLNDRDLANKLGTYHGDFRGDDASWIRELNWIFSLDSSVGESLKSVQQGLADRLGSIVIPSRFTKEVAGPVEISEEGRISSGGKEIGLIDPTFFPILDVIRSRGFVAIARSEGHGKVSLEIEPLRARK